MNKMIRCCAFAASLLIIFSSCKKDDEKSKTELLTESNWKLVSDMYKLNNGAWEDDIISYSACELDNYVDFKTDNTYEANEGPTLCDPLDEQTTKGIWAFTNGESSLSIDGDSEHIDELTESTLTLSSSEVYNGDTYYYKYTFKH